jgi:hypothetical protein
VWVFFTISVLFLTLVMLNLLIGILSKAMGRVLETQESTEYSAQCEIIYDMEVFYAFFRNITCCFNKGIEHEDVY